MSIRLLEIVFALHSITQFYDMKLSDSLIKTNNKINDDEYNFTKY